MITKEKVLKVVARLKTVETMANKEGAFNMAKSTVEIDDEGHPCGTVHCLAGLYVVANYKRPFIKKEISYCLRENIYDASYNFGASLMAKDLGFKALHNLKKWLKRHPEEWGNSCGFYLFCSDEAFNYPGFPGVIKHFEEFAGRLKC